MAEDANYRPIKRIRQACRNCRRKKARCSGEHPICAFCRRLSQTCYYSDDGDSDKRSYERSSSLKRKNNVDSEDSQERSQDDVNKRLSDIEARLTDMAELMSNIASSLQNNSAPVPRSPSLREGPGFVNWQNSLSVPGAPQPSSFTRPPPMETIIGAADIYFRYCHNQPYSLFHEESFRNRLASNEVPQHLLFAFLASSVRYSEDPYYQDKVGAISTYSVQAWKAMVLPWNGIETDVGISIVQTILLLAIIDYTDGKTQGAWIKVGLAIRIAQDFRLMLESDPELPPIQQEERRRVFWSFYIADKLISCGRERPPAILDGNCRVQLPCDELAFRAGQYHQTPRLDEVTSEDASAALNSLSPFALTTVMASILGRCAQYTLGEQENCGQGGQCSPWSPKSKFSTIHSTLLQLESDFGLSESLTAKIRRDFTGVDGTIDQHRGAPLVFSHALFHLCQCLLYHPFLLKQRLMAVKAKAPLSFIAQAFDGCKAAATSLSKLMDEVKMLGCETLSTYYDPFYGYCTMVAGTIHALFSHSRDPHVVDMSQMSLETSMRNLEELSLYWKSSSHMMARLEIFRENSSRYALLIDPTVQIAHLSQADLADLVECLDYSRLSTAPRRKSQGGTSESHPLVSNLPSPFFDDFLNLLPLSNSVRPGEMSFPGVFADDDDFAVLSSDHNTVPTRLPSPPPPGRTTGKAAAIPTNANSSNMNFHTDINGSSNRNSAAGPSHHHSPRSLARSTFSQGSGPSPTSYTHHHQEQAFPHYSQQEREPQHAVPVPACPSQLNPLDATSLPPSYLSHMTSPPLLTSTANPTTNPLSNPAVDRNMAASVNNVPATSGSIGEGAQQRASYRRLSSSITTARRPWYEQSQPHDDSAGAFGDQGQMAGLL